MTDTAAPELASEEHEDGHDGHPSDWFYIQIAIFLFIVTALEVSTYFVDFGGLAIPVLIVLMIIKFAFVVAFFMHLRFDSQLFTALFITGLILALGVYFVVFFAFKIFWEDPVVVPQALGLL